MENEVSKEIAVADVNRWLDLKKVSAKKRELLSSDIESMICAVEEGYLSIDEKCIIKHKLKFPIGENNSIEDLTYKVRVSADDLTDGQKGVTTGADLIAANIATLTGKVKATIKKLDSEDYSVCKAIVAFFM